MRRFILLLIVLMPTLQNCEISGDQEMLELIRLISKQNQELLSEIKSLQTKSDSLINEIKNNASQQKELIERVDFLQSELIKITGSIDSLIEKINNQNGNLEEIKNQLNTLQSQYLIIIEQLEQLQKLSLILVEIDDLKTRLSELNNNYQVLFDLVIQNQSDLSLIKSNIESIQGDLEFKLSLIRELISQIGVQGADIIGIVNKISDLQSQCVELKNQLEFLIGQLSNPFFLENGIIKCPNAKPGDKGFVNGKEYEAVDRNLLILRRDQGADLTCICTSLVTDMGELFMGSVETRNSFNQAIGNWDVSNVTNMNRMFHLSNFNQPIGNWDVGKVKDMGGMFDGNLFFNQPLDKWNVANVTIMQAMFKLSVFNQDINSWDVGKVDDLSRMFEGSTGFNKPLNSWNVRNVTKMNNMFENSQFNQDISNWCVVNFQTEPNAFAHNSPLSPQNKPIWGTCPN